MNRKSNHQNLLRTALTTAGTNMTRLAVTLALVMMTTASALADTTYSYITDLMLIGKNNKTEAETLRKQYVEQGWTAIDQDLNAGCGSKSDYIYLLYKVGNLASANQSFITDIYITTDGTSNINATRNIKGREYKLVPYDGDEHFMEKKGDLNSNAGGDDIHLYYTTDNYNDYKAISSIAFNKTQSDAVGKNGDNSTGYDLNTRAGGDDIYMHCTRNYAPQWIIEKNNDGSGRCIIKGFNVPTGGIGKGDIKAFPSRVCGAQVVGVASSLNYKDFPKLETIYLYEKPLSSVMIPMDGCYNLQHVHTVDINGNVIKSDELPTKITSIPKEGFSGCTALKSISIHAKVTSIGDGAFSGCGITAFTVDKDNPTYKNVNGLLMDKAGKILVAYPCGPRPTGENPTQEYTIPNYVTSIGPKAFSNSYLTSITIPNHVTSIGEGAFWGCTGLTSFTIPSSVTSIEQETFRDCTSLKSIAIPGSVTRIGKGAFRGCTGLTSFTIPASVTSIEQETFYGCTGLTSFTIPDGVTSIGKGAFYHCTSLTSITIPGSVESIGQEAFRDTSLKSITIPGSVTSIGQDAFWGCTGLTSITIPGSVTSIGQGAFTWCTSLTSLTIPGSVTSIGQDAFWGCTGLTSITIEDGMTSIGQGAFRYCSSLTSITIPGSVTSIGQGAFYGCTGLTSVTIENGVESIGQDAFLACSALTNITIPSSVTSIGQGAFYDCDNLASVSIMGNPKIGDSAIPDGTTVTLSLTSNAASGAKWMTFYNDRYNFQADANTTVYKATVVGQSLVLTEVADKIVNGVEWLWGEITAPATAVILKSTGNPVMTRVTGRSSDTQANALIGTMEATATPANCFTLASGSKGVGFYRYTGSEVAAGKAYLIYSGASAAREFIGFDETTGIYSIDNGQLTIDNSWYSLDGRKLQGEPAKKGIYVRNGYTVIIK